MGTILNILRYNSTRGKSGRGRSGGGDGWFVEKGLDFTISKFTSVAFIEFKRCTMISFISEAAVSAESADMLVTLNLSMLEADTSREATLRT